MNVWQISAGFRNVRELTVEIASWSVPQDSAFVISLAGQDNGMNCLSLVWYSTEQLGYRNLGKMYRLDALGIV